MPSACCRLMSRHVQRALGARPLLHRSLPRLGRRRGVRAVRGHRAYRGDATKGPLLDFDSAPSTIVDIQRSPATTEARLLEITAFAIDEHAMVRQTDGVGGMVGIGDRLGFSRRCTSTCPTSSAASRHCCSPCELPRYGMCTWRWRRRRGKGLGMLQNSMRMPTIKLLRLVLSFVNAVANV